MRKAFELALHPRLNLWKVLPASRLAIASVQPELLAVTK